VRWTPSFLLFAAGSVTTSAYGVGSRFGEWGMAATMGAVAAFMVIAAYVLDRVHS